MALYSRHQLALLLTLLGAAGAGLAIGQWKGRYPEVVERIEQFDRSPAPAVPPGRPPKLHRPPAGEPPPGPLDLNRAGPHDLTRLPGIGPALAARIVELRQAEGRLTSLDDLRRIRGLGGARLERLRPYVSVGQAPGRAAASRAPRLRRGARASGEWGAPGAPHD